MGIKRQRQQRRGGEGERGFALLVVFLIAAGVLISLYMEIPRVAFESQRNREELLIERGEEYKRAIELFYRKTKRYPSKMEDLESFNNQRFLRKRYKDPLTGKDEWRLIHMGPNGSLADSLVEKPNQGQLAGNKSGQPGDPTLTAANGGAGGPTTPPDPNAPPNPDDVNVATSRLRQSDRAGAPGRVTANGSSGGGTFTQVDPNAIGNGNQDPNAQMAGNNFNQDPNAGNPNQMPGGNNFYNPNQNPNNFNNPNFNNPNFNNPYGQQQQPGMTSNGPNGPNFTPVGGPNFPGNVNPYGQQPNGMPGNQGPNLYYQNPNGAPFGQQPQPGQPGQGFPVGNPALNAINNQLRNPTATGFGQSGFGQSGFGQSGFGQSNAGQQQMGGAGGFGQQLPASAGQGGAPFGAGIAGVASVEPGVGIKRYNERKKYKEWEFVFDYRKPKGKPGGQGVPGLQSGQLGNSLGNQQQQQQQNTNPFQTNGFTNGMPTVGPGPNRQ